MKRIILVAVAAAALLGSTLGANAGSMHDPFTDSVSEQATHEVIYKGWNLITVPSDIRTYQYADAHPCVQTIAKQDLNAPTRWIFWYRSGGGLQFVMYAGQTYWVYANATCN